MSGEIVVVHRLSLWTAIKMRIAGRDYFDGYADGAAGAATARVEEFDLDLEDDEDED